MVSDAWILVERPRMDNFQKDDIRRLQQEVRQGKELPEGPAAIVTPLAAADTRRWHSS